MTSQQKLARQRGSNFERRVAKLIHGVVVGRSKAVKVNEKYIQVNPQQPPDVVNEWLSVECKYIKHLPKSVLKWITQAVRNSPTGQTPAVFAGDRDGNRVVIMTERDFLDLHER